MCLVQKWQHTQGVQRFVKVLCVLRNQALPPSRVILGTMPCCNAELHIQKKCNISELVCKTYSRQPHFVSSFDILQEANMFAY